MQLTNLETHVKTENGRDSDGRTGRSQSYMEVTLRVEGSEPELLYLQERMFERGGTEGLAVVARSLSSSESDGCYRDSEGECRC